jgi:hypothetical protein
LPVVDGEGPGQGSGLSGICDIDSSVVSGVGSDSSGGGFR